MCFSIICIFLEVIFIITIVTRLNEYAEIINLFTRILSGILVLRLYASDKTSSMKMPWVILILIFPIMGVGLYLLIGLNGGTHKMRERYAEIDSKLLPMLPDNQECLSRIKEKIPKAGNIASYIQRNSWYPIYQNTDIKYFDEAVKGLEAQLEELAKAQKFIFMEYHAIEDAEAWHKIQDVLEERVKAGVEVRVFYDDMGSIGFINTDFVKKMESIGIHCRVFNPFVPGLNLFLNNRDHRKITVIDGKVGFTGGYNLANEYFNYTHPYGQWKDTGIRLLDNEAANLSAGQRQLLTIARVFLCNPPIIILDEATSSVDTRTEVEIGKAMKKLMNGRTSFVIAHRLSTIRDADIILFMEHGNIIEQGSHKELLAQKGAYAALYYSQFE